MVSGVGVGVQGLACRVWGAGSGVRDVLSAFEEGGNEARRDVLRRLCGWRGRGFFPLNYLYAKDVWGVPHAEGVRS